MMKPYMNFRRPEERLEALGDWMPMSKAPWRRSVLAIEVAPGFEEGSSRDFRSGPGCGLSVLGKLRADVTDLQHQCSIGLARGYRDYLLMAIDGPRGIQDPVE